LEKYRFYTTNLSLFGLCVFGSSFMIWESSSYYQQLYNLAGFPKVAGLCLATLSEVFLITLTVSMPDNKDSKWKKYLFLLIISLMYLLSVFGAGASIGKPMFKQWSQSTQKEKLYEILMKEQQSIQSELLLFQEQKQKLNSAVTVKESRRSFQELKNHLNTESPINSIMVKIELSVLWALRVLIQLANLLCSRILAKNLRVKNTSPSAIIQNKASVVRKFKARYTRADNGFVGILEFSDGNYVSVLPDKKRRYKTFKGALGFFDGGLYEGKIAPEPTWQIPN
jgi:hypothetical protein